MTQVYTVFNTAGDLVEDQRSQSISVFGSVVGAERLWLSLWAQFSDLCAGAGGICGVVLVAFARIAPSIGKDRCPDFERE